MVGGRCRRVAPVIGRDHEEVAGPERIEQVFQATVEVLQAAVKVDRVVPVPPGLL
jgi:hypothetical protein